VIIHGQFFFFKHFAKIVCITEEFSDITTFCAMKYQNIYWMSIIDPDSRDGEKYDPKQ
jgi:hypothetical protein